MKTANPWIIESKNSDENLKVWVDTTLKYGQY